MRDIKNTIKLNLILSKETKYIRKLKLTKLISNYFLKNNYMLVWDGGYIESA